MPDAILHICSFLHKDSLAAFTNSLDKISSQRIKVVFLRKLRAANPSIKRSLQGLVLNGSNLKYLKKVLDKNAKIHVYKKGLLGFIGKVEVVKVEALSKFKKRKIAKAEEVFWLSTQQVKGDLSKQKNFPTYKEKQSFSQRVRQAVINHPNCLNHLESMGMLALMIVVVGICLQTPIVPMVLFLAPVIAIALTVALYMYISSSKVDVKQSLAEQISKAGSKEPVKADSFAKIEERISFMNKVDDSLGNAKPRDVASIAM